MGSRYSDDAYGDGDPRSWLPHPLRHLSNLREVINGFSGELQCLEHVQNERVSR
ncbi:hypothetical protein AXF42_Ash014323 [Apostasia shenzhenica]|uniref:Uncharacterized protein n=1 Tax=Apostasia shenzhenica TaxID=1088818 RepID=A0A2I0B0T4_9ASPA|nr:hypothetical protein AXF42_Ash014323 [Apostasia shenzhenica]